MRRIVVVGGGPAGLAAAEHLARAGAQVRLYTDAPYLGGKAGSWTEPGGLVLENGQHVTIGFYEELPALLERAGIDFLATSVSNEGRYTVWEDRDAGTHDLHLGPSSLRSLIDGLTYTGWDWMEKAAFAAFMARALPEVVRGVPEEWDDLCLTAWCLERGLRPSILGTNVFRATRDAQLNWPGEISAYTMLKTIQRAARDYGTGHARFPAGGMTQVWWEPLGAHLERAGVRILRGRKLVRILRDGQRLRGLVFMEAHPERILDGRVGVEPGTREGVEDFDAAIVAIPPHALAEVMGEEALPGLAGASRLLPVAPLGLHVWHRDPCRPRHRTVVLGLPPPLEFAVDNKPFYAVYRDRPDIGSALHFVGQETAFEGVGDDALFRDALGALRRVRGYESMTEEGVLAWRIVRNRAPHQRYWNGEPGALRFKPWPRSPISRLFLAGDWVRSDLDFPCMENAVHTGIAAARLAMGEGRPDRGQ